MGPHYGLARAPEQAQTVRLRLAHAPAKQDTAQMKLGLLSDTHNHLPETRRALDVLLRHGARHLVHCGDVGEDVVDLLSATCQEHGLRAHLAIGNCDRMYGDNPALYPQPTGITRGEYLEFVLAGKRCLVMHGDNRRRLAPAIASGTLDYIFLGHTHEPHDERQGPTRLLNPGSVSRPRRGPPTVLLLDLPTATPTWLPLA